MRTEDFKEFVKTAKKFYDKSRNIPVTQNILFSGNTATIVNFSDPSRAIIINEYCLLMPLHIKVK